ncbi:hypothetical protein HN832_02365 [archaeon]|jgi:hypothetical protein|nr:hypothetical protein [archaeon]MBT4373198.1 hypothetical protein [archaeon]MBT4531543.1 hypothetical protein [archaeon]MBT7001279.1 hypothetical protein [archaeon]MBT7282235.1 hypothetical protein [archaeon]
MLNEVSVAEFKAPWIEMYESAKGKLNADYRQKIVRGLREKFDIYEGIFKRGDAIYFICPTNTKADVFVDAVVLPKQERKGDLEDIHLTEADYERLKKIFLKKENNSDIDERLKLGMVRISNTSIGMMGLVGLQNLKELEQYGHTNIMGDPVTD